jgi:hypothetical protein
MCWKCHQGLSNKIIHEQLTEALNNPMFERWNECSVSHLLIVESGYNGEENKALATTMLDRYLAFLFSRKSFLTRNKIKMEREVFKLPYNKEARKEKQKDEGKSITSKDMMSFDVPE